MIPVVVSGPVLVENSQFCPKCGQMCGHAGAGERDGGPDGGYSEEADERFGRERIDIEWVFAGEQLYIVQTRPLVR